MIKKILVYIILLSLLFFICFLNYQKISDLEDRVSSLEDSVSDLESKKDDFESRIDELEQRINYR